MVLGTGCIIQLTVQLAMLVCIIFGMFHKGGRGCVMCQFIEPVTFACCAFIFALRNIALGGYLDTQKHLEHNYTE